MSNIYDMSGKKKVMFTEKIDEELCDEGIGCTKCWMNAINKLKKEEL